MNPRVVGAALAIAAAGCAKDAPSAASNAPRAEESAGGLAADDRIAWLLAPCARNEPFLADTGDTIPILVATLARGQLDPLRQAKSELAQIGDPALPELRRFCENALRDPAGGPRLLNALAVVANMRTDEGRDVLIGALAHPQETIRLEAVRGLTQHARAEDYDRLLALVPISSGDVLNALGAALFAADRRRMEDDFAAWLAGERAHPALWLPAAERLCDTERPEILERFRDLEPKVEGETRVCLTATLARAGDATALERLRAAAKDGNPAQRSAATRALDRIDRVEDLAPRLVEDPDPLLRVFVAGALARRASDPKIDAWLEKGTHDRARDVRFTCLAALVTRGDAAARDEALQLLRGDRADVEAGLRVLRERIQVDPALARAAFDVLHRLRAGELAPLRVDVLTLDRAIAQMPDLDATRELLDRARSSTASIEGLTAHRWYLMQAGNTGAQGRTWLRERWSDETDPARRVDIVMAGAYDRDDASREFLVRVVESERSTPLEVLYAANLLVHQGPASVAAPVLKRVTLRVSDPAVRPALNCLLWTWYGAGS